MVTKNVDICKIAKSLRLGQLLIVFALATPHYLN